MIELPQRLAAFIGGLGFLMALLVGILNYPYGIGLALVAWRSVVIFLILFGLGWLLGTVIVCLIPEPKGESEAEEQHVDVAFDQNPEEWEELDSIEDEESNESDGSSSVPV